MHCSAESFRDFYPLSFFVALIADIIIKKIAERLAKDYSLPQLVKLHGETLETKMRSALISLANDGTTSNLPGLSK